MIKASITDGQQAEVRGPHRTGRRDVRRLFRRGLTAIVGTGLAILCVAQSSCAVDDIEYCEKDATCVANFGTDYFCMTATRSCMQRGNNGCSNDTDCTDRAMPVCNMAEGRCMACVQGDTTSCKQFPDTPVCGSGTSGGTACVQCSTNADCKDAAAPICVAQVCRKCSKHTDCEGSLTCHDGNYCNDSMVCIGEGELGTGMAGRCAQNADRGQVVYVRATTGCLNSGTVGGTSIDQPFCNIDLGYAAAVAQANRRYIRVLGGTDVIYDAMATPILSGKYVFIGAPSNSRQVAKPARISSRGTTFETDESADVTIDEFSLLSVLPYKSVLSCNGTSTKLPTFTLRNSTVEGSAMLNDFGLEPAIALDRCNARIYNNIIGAQTLAETKRADATVLRAGIAIGVSTNNPGPMLTEIYNNVIAGVGAYAVDIETRVNLSTIVMRFNTLVNNGRFNRAGGIWAPLKFMTNANVTVGQTILQNNMLGGVQNSGEDSIIWQDTVISSMDATTQPGLTKADLQLDDAFKPITTSAVNLMYCIDKVTQPPAGATFPTFDQGRNPRPKGAAYDIGAYEVT